MLLTFSYYYRGRIFDFPVLLFLTPVSLISADWKPLSFMLSLLFLFPYFTLSAFVKIPISVLVLFPASFIFLYWKCRVCTCEFAHEILGKWRELVCAHIVHRNFKSEGLHSPLKSSISTALNRSTSLILMLKVQSSFCTIWERSTILSCLILG